MNSADKIRFCTLVNLIMLNLLLVVMDNSRYPLFQA